MSTKQPSREVLDLGDKPRPQGPLIVPEEAGPDSPGHFSNLEKQIQALRGVDDPSHRGDATVDWRTQVVAPPAARWPRLPGYEILGELRRGGMGRVYKARHEKLGRFVALKMVRHFFDENTTRRFINEARTLARLQHPHIVQIHDIGEHDGELYLSMEFMAGGNLSQRLARQPIAPDEAAQLLGTLARTVHCAHEQNIIHRDLKPSNILLSADGTPKIADFGLAKDLGQDSGTTMSGEILGTPSYMAPEQAAGRNKEVGPATDVYALGATLYEMLAGRAPFQGDGALRRVIEEIPLPPSRYEEGVPRALDVICLRCLEKNPARRYPTALALAEDLDRFLKGEPISARPWTWPPHVWQAVRRYAAAATAVLFALILLVILIGTRLLAPAPLDVLMSELRAGKGVDLIGPAGKPHWQRWWGGTATLVNRPDERSFTLQSFGGYQFLELLPGPPLERYRFKALVRHDDANIGDTRVGLFFGLTPLPPPADPLFAAWTLSFNDIHDLSANASPGVPRGNPLSYLLLARPIDEQVAAAQGKVGGSILLFEPRLNKHEHNPWRELQVDVTPDSVRVTWDGGAPVTRPVKGMVAMFRGQLARQWPGLDAAGIDPSLQGGLGVFLYQGVASFKEIRVEPLP
jgi:serine/threonine-protein kinase